MGKMGNQRGRGSRLAQARREPSSILPEVRSALFVFDSPRPFSTHVVTLSRIRKLCAYARTRIELHFSAQVIH